jgi:hypothetical protein
MHFDKLERNKKPKNCIAQFGFYAWIEPKKCVHGILLSAFFFILSFYKSFLKISNISKMNFSISKFEWII